MTKEKATEITTTIEGRRHTYEQRRESNRKRMYGARQITKHRGWGEERHTADRGNRAGQLSDGCLDSVRGGVAD